MRMQSNRNRRGMASVMAMMYLALIAALAVGFYTAVSTSGTIAGNESSIQHASTTAETGVAFWRYQSNVISVPYFTSYSNLIPTIYASMQTYCTDLTDYTASNWTYPTEEPSVSPTAIAIPGQPNAWSWSPTLPWTVGDDLPALPSNTNWISTDSIGDESFMFLTQASGTNDLYLVSIGQNTNNVSASANSSANTLVQRKVQLEFTPASLPLLQYGLVSYGEVFINSTGANSTSVSGGLWVISNSTPLSVTGTGADSVASDASGIGDVYYTENTPYTSLNWASMKVDGYSSSQGNSFGSHVHANQPAPQYLTFDTSGFVQYAGAPTGSGTLSAGTISTSQSDKFLSAGNYTIQGVNTTLANITFDGGGTIAINATGVTLTNITLDAGTYVFNISGTDQLNLNGVILLEPGVNLTINGVSGKLVINGTMVQVPNSNSTTYTVTFGVGTMVQNDMSTSGIGVGAAEALLTGSALLLGTDKVTFNGTTLTSVDTIVTGQMTENTTSKITITSGSFVNMGTTMTINGALTITNPPPTSTLHAGINYGFAATPTSYTEVYP